ncbi:TonB-dependent receptor [Sphingobacterium tabacisoli]|uniref:TonB-dependent receptor n=1 Tax=Sphingobacterium tabacisoli TaxID=2044855 RepID=A0ABW5L1K5_9SPHI|nr:TonB-dependent receptor [Sphingobacterium tabacisoli]
MRYLTTNLTLLLALLGVTASAQVSKDSTNIALQPIDVKVYFAKQSSLGVTSATQSLSAEVISRQSPTSLLAAVNTVPGIRMEERSPGSYRLAMRGSLIRSPFGIRNTKVYVDEFPLTDAGGNTYLNLLAPVGIQTIQLVKGPDGSLFGANSGGVVQISPKGFEMLENRREVELTAGAYGLFQQSLSLQQKVTPNYQFSFDQSFLRSDGYRDNAGLNKKTVQTAHQWQYAPIAQLRAFILYTDLGYETPGGLTLEQYEADPRASRPAGGPNPGAKEQQAAIYNKTGFGGVSHRLQLGKYLSHQISLFGSYTDFKNPFITNYEERIEKNWGLRTYLSLGNQQAALPWQMQLGFEGIKGSSTIDNYDNNKGVAGAVQARDGMTNSQWNLFYRAQIELIKNWNLEGALGLNGNHIDYTRKYPVVTPTDGHISFDKQWMPRIASSYTLHEIMSWRVSVAKGYSTPTLAEVRSSDNSINTDLQAESGTNYEVGYKIRNKNNNLILDIAAYTYRMENGIVRSLNEAGAEYYQNAGEMKQKGIELSLWGAIPVSPQSPLLRGMSVHTAVSYNDYHFGQYKVADKDYSGNRMTAVPQWVWTNNVKIDFPYQLDLNLYHNFTSSMPLGDANSIYAKKFHLVQAKLSYTVPRFYGVSVQVYAGGDNLLNQRYSLGNDINAFGGRYFNAAATRNFYGGLKLIF